MSNDPPNHPRTDAAQALGAHDQGTGGVIPSVHPSVIFERRHDGSFPAGRDYGRPANPVAEAVEGLLARLEGGARALVYSSGMAAATAVLESLPIGARVLGQDRMYWGMRNALLEHGQRGRLAVELLPAGDAAALDRALARAPAQLVWIETPSNPTLDLVDIERFAQSCRRAGAKLAVDSTVATPVHTTPLQLGADLVMHSATKALNGHSDLLAGALVTRDGDDPLWRELVAARSRVGAVLGAFEAWLLLRGMRTLYVRQERAAASALTLAQRLLGHPAVAAVHYPGLATHPQHALARRQMSGGFGALLSLEVRGGEAAARRVANTLRVFTQATSLGGVESLVEHRRSVEGEGSLAPPELLRLSIGIEHPADLERDLVTALDAVALG